MRLKNGWILTLVLFLCLPLLTAGAWSSVPSSEPAHRVAEAQLEVSLGERELRVLVDGEVIRTYDVAIGTDDHETPTGSFAIRRIIFNPSWTPPNVPWARGKRPTPPGDPNNPMGKAKIFFAEPDYYIHGTNDEASIGRAASHGCLRMRNEDVVALAKLVMEYGGESRPESWFQRIKNVVTRSEEVRLSTPVQIRVES
jgi:lipoprotein-anchoring transpeptidase ErfK/SrfK